MNTLNSISPFVLALTIVLAMSVPAHADRYDDPTRTNIETTQPLDSSENYADVMLDFA